MPGWGDSTRKKSDKFADLVAQKYKEKYQSQNPDDAAVSISDELHAWLSFHYFSVAKDGHDASIKYDYEQELNSLNERAQRYSRIPKKFEQINDEKQFLYQKFITNTQDATINPNDFINREMAAEAVANFLVKRNLNSDNQPDYSNNSEAYDYSIKKLIESNAIRTTSAMRWFDKNVVNMSKSALDATASYKAKEVTIPKEADVNELVGRLHGKLTSRNAINTVADYLESRGEFDAVKAATKIRNNSSQIRIEKNKFFNNRDALVAAVMEKMSDSNETPFADLESKSQEVLKPIRDVAFDAWKEGYKYGKRSDFDALYPNEIYLMTKKNGKTFTFLPDERRLLIRGHDFLGDPAVEEYKDYRLYDWINDNFDHTQGLIKGLNLSYNFHHGFKIPPENQHKAAFGVFQRIAFDAWSKQDENKGKEFAEFQQLYPNRVAVQVDGGIVVCTPTTAKLNGEPLPDPYNSAYSTLEKIKDPKKSISIELVKEAVPDIAFDIWKNHKDNKHGKRSDFDELYPDPKLTDFADGKLPKPTLENEHKVAFKIFQKLAFDSWHKKEENSNKEFSDFQQLYPEKISIEWNNQEKITITPTTLTINGRSKQGGYSAATSARLQAPRFNDILHFVEETRDQQPESPTPLSEETLKQDTTSEKKPDVAANDGKGHTEEEAEVDSLQPDSTVETKPEGPQDTQDDEPDAPTQNNPLPSATAPNNDDAEFEQSKKNLFDQVLKDLEPKNTKSEQPTNDQANNVSTLEEQEEVSEQEGVVTEDLDEPEIQEEASKVNTEKDVGQSAVDETPAAQPPVNVAENANQQTSAKIDPSTTKPTVIPATTNAIDAAPIMPPLLALSATEKEKSDKFADLVAQKYKEKYQSLHPDAAVDISRNQDGLHEWLSHHFNSVARESYLKPITQQYERSINLEESTHRYHTAEYDKPGSDKKFQLKQMEKSTEKQRRLNAKYASDQNTTINPNDFIDKESAAEAVAEYLAKRDLNSSKQPDYLNNTEAYDYSIKKILTDHTQKTTSSDRWLKKTFGLASTPTKKVVSPEQQDFINQIVARFDDDDFTIDHAKRIVEQDLIDKGEYAPVKAAQKQHERFRSNNSYKSTYEQKLAEFNEKCAAILDPVVERLSDSRMSTPEKLASKCDQAFKAIQDIAFDAWKNKEENKLGERSDFNELYPDRIVLEVNGDKLECSKRSISIGDQTFYGTRSTEMFDIIHYKLQPGLNELKENGELIDFSNENRPAIENENKAAFKLFQKMAFNAWHQQDENKDKEFADFQELYPDKVTVKVGDDTCTSTPTTVVINGTTYSHPYQAANSVRQQWVNAQINFVEDQQTQQSEPPTPDTQSNNSKKEADVNDGKDQTEKEADEDRPDPNVETQSDTQSNARADGEKDKEVNLENPTADEVDEDEIDAQTQGHPLPSSTTLNDDQTDFEQTRKVFNNLFDQMLKKLEPNSTSKQPSDEKAVEEQEEISDLDSEISEQDSVATRDDTSQMQEDVSDIASEISTEDNISIAEENEKDLGHSVLDETPEVQPQVHVAENSSQTTSSSTPNPPATKPTSLPATTEAVDETLPQPSDQKSHVSEAVDDLVDEMLQEAGSLGSSKSNIPSKESNDASQTSEDTPEVKLTLKQKLQRMKIAQAASKLKTTVEETTQQEEVPPLDTSRPNTPTSQQSDNSSNASKETPEVTLTALQRLKKQMASAEAGSEFKAAVNAATKKSNVATKSNTQSKEEAPLGKIRPNTPPSPQSNDSSKTSKETPEKKLTPLQLLKQKQMESAAAANTATKESNIDKPKTPSKGEEAKQKEVALEKGQSSQPNKDSTKTSIAEALQKMRERKMMIEVGSPKLSKIVTTATGAGKQSLEKTSSVSRSSSPTASNRSSSDSLSSLSSGRTTQQNSSSSLSSFATRSSIGSEKSPNLKGVPSFGKVVDKAVQKNGVNSSQNATSNTLPRSESTKSSNTTSSPQPEPTKISMREKILNAQRKAKEQKGKEL